ncbi:nuclear transport factor 2 family protein [Cupriavidus sp. UYPR2.512]|uniref:nuclear transport factor 2 family protein n=1 Tax=Cupriavidus sp. UYPR2.512 TaxID=1080187 RepID=UPI0003708FBF|nr:nuclear transport factor 2 family protein [Cupriavidus sp. UYPR2.512]UIF90002.1 nuclear transport factor 2 family protein [Cupriavidus necator]
MQKQSDMNPSSAARRHLAAAVLAVCTGAAALLSAPQVSAQTVRAATSKKPVDVVKDFLQNTAPDKVDAAAKRLVAPDATYISLSFDNPELKQIEPWAGTSKGPEAFSSTFSRVAKYWTIEDFKVTDIFGAGDDVAVFGTFTYRSVAVGTSFRSPFSIHAKVKNGKITYFQFMEDTYASASSFRQSGSWTVKTDPSAASYEVGKAK